MSGIHLFGRLEVLLSLTTKIASRIPTSDPIERSWYIKTALFRVQDRTIRLNRPVIPTIDDPRATLATIWSRVMGLYTVPRVLDATDATAHAFSKRLSPRNAVAGHRRKNLRAQTGTVADLGAQIALKANKRRENTIWTHCFSYQRPELKPGTGSDTAVRLENRCHKCLYAKIKAPILLRGRP